MRYWKKCNVFLSLVVTLAILASLVPLGSEMAQAQQAKPRDTAATLSISSGAATLGNTVVTELWLNGYSGTAGLGAYNVYVLFDRTKLQANTVQGSGVTDDPYFGGTPTNNRVTANASTGELRLNALHSEIPGPGSPSAQAGFTGPNIKLARITWQLNASGAQALTLQAITLSDTAGNNLDPAPALQNGTLTVWAVPVASFTTSYNPSSGAAPNTVTFTDTSTGPGQTFAWTFGDGGSSTEQNPSHVYSAAGNYTVGLTVTNPAGSSSTSGTVNIYTTPVAVFTRVLNPTTGLAPNTVTFTDASTGNVTGWSWSFGDGSVSSSQNPTKTYSTAGNYTVTLTATNPVGSNSSSQTVGIYSVPAASFTRSASSGNSPLTVNFTDTSTGNITGWSWNFGDGSGSSSQNPSKTYNTYGNYTVTLSATNPAGANTSAGQTISVYSVPVANFSASPTSTNPGANITFTDTSTGNITSWSWNFGDSTGSSTQNPTKSYAADSSYTVSLTATNPAGADTVTKTAYIVIVSYKAETGMTIGIEPTVSNNAYINAGINRFFNPITNDTVTLDAIGAFNAYMSYAAGKVSMKHKKAEGGFPSLTVNYDTEGGTKTNVNAVNAESLATAPTDLFKLFPHLTGTAIESVTVTLHFTTITRLAGGEVPQNADVSKTFRRGDANSNGEVTITDALFIAQYLAGLRNLGETSVLVNPVNSATPRNDLTTGANITIQDALYIAQWLAALRDDSYNM